VDGIGPDIGTGPLGISVSVIIALVSIAPLLSSSTLRGKNVSLADDVVVMAVVSCGKFEAWVCDREAPNFEWDGEICGGVVRHCGHSRDWDEAAIPESLDEKSCRLLMALLVRRDNALSGPEECECLGEEWSINDVCVSVIEMMFESPKSACSTDRSNVGGESGISITGSEEEC
jgi:hypothetical protein